MGGTFDPIHIGHLMVAEEARFRFGLDRVIFVPSARPPHKADIPNSPPLDRKRMVELAINGNPFLEMSEIELDREGPSYTIDTLRELRRINGEDAELYFIIGADAMSEILTWKEPEDVLAESEFIVATRPGCSLDRLRDALPAGADAMKSVYCMEIPALAISSTDIRSRVHDGRPFRYLVPDAVLEYIKANGLYQ
ncbi:MAG: nicotinic acid mononucleotide adenylyltransferase [Candidatus Anoxymicrobium japonicum]|uniref:Probable nicotinate-nucleotide adenylyltransferase n=1 Tax=Candidatus Anoxymicrobium japonicum TaxID=2013648 RepID=A0A2N3G6T7_9ACTN|nr:MAG: nicotinic acid mononucleotide adenylyltransferase [Candidatus Anoxymicrobium japonicum]